MGSASAGMSRGAMLPQAIGIAINKSTLMRCHTDDTSGVNRIIHAVAVTMMRMMLGRDASTVKSSGRAAGATSTLTSMRMS